MTMYFLVSDTFLKIPCSDLFLRQSGPKVLELAPSQALANLPPAFTCLEEGQRELHFREGLKKHVFYPHIVDKGGGVRRCGYFFLFYFVYNIIIKCLNVDKGRGGGGGGAKMCKPIQTDSAGNLANKYLQK